MKWNAAPNSCESFSYGEVEDYMVNISAGTPQAPVANFTASSTSVSVGGSVSFTDQSANTPTSWSWSFPGGTPSNSTAQNPTVTYNTVGTYNVTLIATNAIGSDTATKTAYITVSVNSDPIAEALDYPGLSFTLTGNQDWYVTTADSFYGGSSVTIPSALGNNQSSTMETTISGKTSVSFYWKVSSEAKYDYLKFYIDGVLQEQISGTVGWTLKSYSVSSGSHTLKWIYDKDYSVSSGSDAGWVDRLILN